METEVLKTKVTKLLEKWKHLLESLQRNEVVAGFGNARAKQLLDEYWDILQHIFDDIVLEMDKQGFDSDSERSIPPSVWKVMQPKIQPLITMYQNDIKSYFSQYQSSLDQLDADIVEELTYFKEMGMKELLQLFNSFMQE
jgi:hypothetical protein